MTENPAPAALVDDIESATAEPARRLPWRSSLALWSDDWRERWGRAANVLEDQGQTWHEAERLAFVATSAEKRSEAVALAN